MNPKTFSTLNFSEEIYKLDKEISNKLGKKLDLYINSYVKLIKAMVPSK